MDGISGDVSVVKAGEDMTQAVIRIQNSGSEATEESLALQMVENIQKIYPNASYEGIESAGGTASGDLITSEDGSGDCIRSHAHLYLDPV